MHSEQFMWTQHPNPRMRIRTDGRYWVIAEPTTWDADDSCEFAARVYHGTFPIRIAEVGIAWAETMELALVRAIESVEQHMLSATSPVALSAEPQIWNGGADSQIHSSQFAHEWQL